MSSPTPRCRSPSICTTCHEATCSKGIAIIICVAPSPALDRTLLVDAVVAGHIHRPHDAVSVAGGKGFNVARSARALGADVVAAAILGGPTGAHVEHLLRADGINARVIEGTSDTRTCTSIASMSTSTLTEFYELAAAVTLDEWQALETSIGIELALDASWLTISGSMPSGAPIDAVARLTSLAHSYGARIAIDTHGPALSLALEHQPDIVKVNVHEAAAVLGLSVDPTPHMAATALHDRQGWLTVVTAGTAGAWAVAGGPVWHVGAAQTGAFPVGSGDAFLAGLITGLVESGDDIAGALALAAGTAAANAQIPGAGVLDPEQARSWAADIVVAVSP